jgi:uncharacterized protein (DUF58 family)
MTNAMTGTKVSLTVAGSDLSWLMDVVQAVQATYSVTAVQTPHPVSDLSPARSDQPSCAIVALSDDDSAVDVRELLDRSPHVRFVFVAQTLPVRHAVARVIREHGHTVLSCSEPALVIAATATALMTEPESAP